MLCLCLPLLNSMPACYPILALLSLGAITLKSSMVQVPSEQWAQVRGTACHLSREDQMSKASDGTEQQRLVRTAAEERQKAASCH